MWPAGVVIDPPGFDGFPGILQVQEPVLVEAFVSKLAVEGFDKCVLNRLAGVDEVQADTVALGPLVESLTDLLQWLG